MATALEVSESELLRGTQKKSLWSRLRKIWAMSPPRNLLLRTTLVWLAALLLMEPIVLLLQQAYLANGGESPLFITSLNPYGAAALALRALPSLIAGLRLSRAAHQQQPFPQIRGNILAVWLRHCLPGLAIAFALWFFVFVLCFWEFTDLGWNIAGLANVLAEWEPTGPNSRTVALSWRNLPWFILGSFLSGAYCFRALVCYLFYGVGVCRYLTRCP